MNYATAREIDRSEIPVIDLTPLSGDGGGMDAVAHALIRAAEGSGFFYVRNHGIAQARIDAMLAAGRAFFARPLEEKQAVAVNRYHRGFIRQGEARMYGGALPDLKESFVWGRDVAADDPEHQAGHPLIGPNRWPGFMPELKAALTDYLDACNVLGFRLMRAFAHALGEPGDRFVQRIDRPLSRGSLIYYPPQDAALGARQFGVAPHTDYGCLTLLYQDSTGGLQVAGRGGEWLTAHPIPGTFVVNVGDLLARWTNGRFASTPHRVVNSSGRERYSVAVFVDPNHDTVIEPVTAAGDPPRYPTVTCGEHILDRYNASFAYRNESGGAAG